MRKLRISVFYRVFISSQIDLSMIPPDRTVASATSTAASGAQVIADQSVDFQMSQNDVPLRFAVLGSTCSIGKNTLEVIAASDGRFEVYLLCGHRSIDMLV